MGLVSEEVESKQEFKTRTANEEKKATRKVKLYGQFSDVKKRPRCRGTA